MAREEVTGRQKQVFQLIADGRHPKQVAQDLSIATATVNRHIQHAKRNLHAESTPAAVAKLLRRGEIK